MLLSACEHQGSLRPDCAIDAGPCTRTVEGVSVTLDITPKPVRAMRDLAFSVDLVRGGLPVTGADAEIDLTMPGMDMGENRVRLLHEGEGRHRGRGVIVRCPSGQTLWKASVVVAEDKRSLTADFLIDVP